MLSDIQKKKITNNFKGKKLLFLVGYFIVFFAINGFLNDWAETKFAFLDYEPFVKYCYVFFTLANNFFVALSVALFVEKMKEMRQMNPTGSILWLLWTGTAILTGACPGCIAWVFPFFMWLFGSHFALWALPFHWVELQALSFVFLLIWVYFLSRDMTCKIR